MPASAKKPRSATAKSLPEPVLFRWNQLLVAGFFLWTFLSLVFPLYDTDFWWHLKTGDLILQEGTVPQIDRYTYMDYDAPWIDLHWGFQVLISLLYRVGGVDLVILTKATVITAAVAVAWQATGRGLPPALKALLWLLPVIAISGRGYERPEMLSQLFLAIWLFVAFRVEEQPRLIWLLPAVQLLWANCHALFVLGLVVGGCFLVDRLARHLAEGRFGLAPPAQQPSVHALIRAGGLVVVACFATPYFEAGFLFPLTLYRKFTVDQGFYSTNIGEFRQPITYILNYGVSNLYLLAEIGVFALTAASFVRLWRRQRSWNVLRLLLFAAFLHLAWEATRNTNIFSLVAGTVLCANVAELLAHRKVPIEARDELRYSQVVCAGLAFFMVLVVTGEWNRWGEGNKPFGLGEAKNWFIHDAAKFAGQPGFPERAFVSNIGQAAVYTYHNWPERQVFMDGRLEVCTLQTFMVYNQVRTLMAMRNPGWAGLVAPKDMALPTVILDPHTTLEPLVEMLFTPGWRLVYADPTAGVFLDDATADKLHLEKADWSALALSPRVRAAVKGYEATVIEEERKRKSGE